MNQEFSVNPSNYALAINRLIYSEFKTAASYPRFSGFMLPMDYPEYWQDALGPDVSGLSHPDVVARRTDNFLKTDGDKFTLFERQALVSVAKIHDVEEIKFRNIGKGDVADPAKKDESRALATAMTRMYVYKALNDLTKKDYQLQFEQLFADKKRLEHPVELFNAAADYLKDNLDPGEKNEGQILINQYRIIVNNPESKLGKPFRLIEKIQYVATGIAAYEGYHPYPRKTLYLDRPYFIGNRVLFAAETIQFHLPHLIGSSKEFAYPALFLKQNEKTINGMIKLVHAELDPNQNSFVYQGNGNNSYFSWGKFNAAAQAWQEWQQQSLPNPPTTPRRPGKFLVTPFRPRQN